MNSNSRLSLSTDATPRASHSGTTFAQSSGRAIGSPSKERPAVSGRRQNRSQGKQRQHPNSSDRIKRRTVQMQLPNFFLRPASRDAMASHESPVPLRSTPATPSTGWPENSSYRQSEGGVGGNEARSPKKRRLSPVASLLGRAPQSTLRSGARQGQEPSCRLAAKSDQQVEEFDDEEEAWMQRARNFTGRQHAKESGAAVTPYQAQHPSRNQKSSASYSPTKLPPSHNAPAVFPIEETPWLHDSLSDLSMLPWERDAALKLPQYRTHTGAKVTQRDLQIKRTMEQAMAETAQREAIARSTGKFHQRRVDPGRRQRISDPNHAPECRPQAHSAAPLERSVRIERPRTPNPPPQATPRRMPLSPRSQPNVSPPRYGRRLFDPITVSGDVEAGENAENGSMTHSTHSVLDRRQSATQNTQGMHPVTPVADLPVLRSPRSKRKVYAIETQDGAPLPSPSDMQAAGITHLTSRAHAGSSSASRLPAGCLIHGKHSDTPRKPDSRLWSTHKSAPRSVSTKRPRELSSARESSNGDEEDGGYAADSSSPLPSADETQALDGVYDDETDETVPRIAVGPPNSKSKESSRKGDHEDKDMDETQPLAFPSSCEMSSEEEDDLLAMRPCKSRPTRDIPGDANAGIPHRKFETPSGWASVREAWEGLDINSTKDNQQLLPRHHQPTLGRYGFDETPTSRRAIAATDEPALPPSNEEVFDHPLSRDVTDHLSEDETECPNIEADDSGFVEGTGVVSKGHIKDMRSGWNCASPSQHASLSIPPKEGAQESQFTQPLDWDDDEEISGEPRSNTQDSSHTEDEAVLPMEVLRRMKTKLAEWPKCAGKEDHSKPRHWGASDAHVGRKDGKDGSRSGGGSDVEGDGSDSDSWVPERLPTQAESFFARL